MRYSVKPKGICPTDIAFDLEGDVVKNVAFTRGCDGNLKAVSKLIDGMTVGQIESILRGNLCGNRGTSCADQLAKALRECYDKSLNEENR